MTNRTELLPDACPEPDGQEVVGYFNIVTDGEITGTRPVSAHEVMIDHAGACPWCGEEEG